MLFRSTAQPFLGTNAWRIPLNPALAAAPTSVIDGPVGVAVNGVPIFNPCKQGGCQNGDTKVLGELDICNGHAGRADDYHYHVTPLHLQDKVGSGQPVAVALDGYPIYGLTEPDGSSPKDLDSCHGHETKELGYHYHAAKSYPYVLGGFHGEVTERENQVDPQPRAQPFRPAGEIGRAHV